jgi:hypothetical protein
MKTRMTIIAMTMVIALQMGFGKEPGKKIMTMEERIESAKKNCLVALKSDNEGVVQGSIALAARIKLRAPATEMEDIQKMLNELSNEHSSATVRYEAYIASNICDDPKWYVEDISVTSAKEEQFFIAATNRLQQKLFGLNSY